jgi:hypothetical protein
MRDPTLALAVAYRIAVASAAHTKITVLAPMPLTDFQTATR